MKKRVPVNPQALALVRSPPTGRSTYSLTQAAQIGGVHPELLRYYCQIGLFGKGPIRLEAEFSFDDDDLYELRRFEHYRRHHGISRRTLRVWCALWREINQLKTELRFYRGN